MAGSAVVRDGRVVGATAGLAELLGLPDPAAAVGVHLAAWLGDEPPADGAWLLRRPDGRRLAVDLRLEPLSGDAGSVLLRVRPLAGESADAALYRAVFDRNSAVKLLIDPSDGQIVDANAAAVAFYGWPREELVRKRITEINLLGPEAVAGALAEAALGTRATFHFRHRLASGEVRHVDVHSGPVEVGGRRLLLSIVQDATDRVVLAQLQRTELVGRLAGGVAHDFNNLLTVMLGCGEVLGQEIPADAPGRPALDDLLHAVRRAGELTRRLLDVGGRQVLVPRAVELGDLVDQIAGLLASAAQPAALRIAIPPGLVAALDPGRFEQVLVNLVLNAREAGARRIDLYGERDGDAVVLRVRDDGRGMDEATLGQIFEPFFSTKAPGSSHGLGLASVHGTVVRSGGTIRVESAPGCGATFTMRFPDAARASLRPRVPSPVPAPPGAHRVLLVDDEPDVRGVLVLALEHAGFVVRGVGSAEEALALPADVLAALDAVVTDQGMPGRSGVALARELRARIADLPIVVISGDLGARDRGELPPDVQFLQKPFSGRELARVLRARIARRGRAPAG